MNAFNFQKTYKREIGTPLIMQCNPTLTPADPPGMARPQEAALSAYFSQYSPELTSIDRLQLQMISNLDPAPRCLPLGMGQMADPFLLQGDLEFTCKVLANMWPLHLDYKSLKTFVKC